MLASTFLFAGLTAFYPGPGDNELTRDEKKNGWKLLFDGKSTDGWRIYQNKKANSWQIANGELYCIKDAKDHADLITKEKYGDFELVFDWKVDKAANSGVIYHVTEG